MPVSTKYFIAFSFTCLLLTSHAQVNYIQFINPFIGTGGHGHTFPGATVPFGMVQLSPDTRIDGSWDGCSGYHHSDDFIYGFSHTHLSGTGCSDYGDIAILPYDRIEDEKAMAEEKNMQFDYGTFCERFNHVNEKAEAGYYKVKFENDIVAELTSTTRCGMHKYTFVKGEGADIVLKLTHRDKTIQSELKMVDKTHLEGFRRSSAWAQDQHIYFVVEFSSPATYIIDHRSKNNEKNTNIEDFACYSFKKLKNKPLLIKVGISNVSIENARKNLAAEIKGWDFEKVKKDAQAAWNKELSKIEVTSTDKDKLTTFYTSLYHCMIHPSTASDVDGSYRGRDNKIHKAEGYTYYTVFSLWDTFRGLHPLLTIIDQKRTHDFIQTFLAQYKDGGRLPVWELSSNETECMIGYHSVSVIADAYAKNIISNEDAKTALGAMMHSSHSGLFGTNEFQLNGYLTIENEHESVSKTLEYAYDDWCIGTLAEKLGEKDIAAAWYSHGAGWKNLFDPKTGFIRPRSNGGWLSPFEPREVNNNFTEANAWQYTFFVPQDIEGLKKALGGEEKFIAKLDELFNASSKTEGRDQADITGLIGQYAHGNEPSHHMAYLYVYGKKPWKTQSLIHKIQTEFYKNNPDGLIGNEDCGQMSAWHVLSALGFYQVCPGKPEYALGTPSFEKSTIHLENGKSFTIHAKNLDNDNYYIKDVPRFYVTHDEIMNGGEFVMQMSNKPIYEVITSSVKHFPVTANETRDIPVPVFLTNTKTFNDSLKIELLAPTDPSNQLYYTFNNPFSENESWEEGQFKYTGPFYIKESKKIWAYYINATQNWGSHQSFASFHKIPHNWTVKINGKYNAQYTAGGDAGIIDGLHGDKDWRKGGWQGYQAQDFECIVDLQKPIQVGQVDVTFLQDTRAWIFFPKSVEFYSSYDGKNWDKFGANPVQDIPIASEDLPIEIKKIGTFTKPIQARYIKIKAVNFGKLPKWHVGSGMNGDDAFIFVDEIEVK
ncbi:MAG TPA: GH92 family glycosyl hydrolase [Flavobacteriales bacterium]|nr:GH92 family glycosyl hydrolase [Flavobacteriales bacterium]